MIFMPRETANSLLKFKEIVWKSKVLVVQEPSEKKNREE